MIHTILINDDNTITKSMVGNIMHRSSNVDTLRILVSPTYKDEYGNLLMADCTCLMELVSPIGRTYKPKTLTPSEELYKERLEYLVPIDITMTKEVGNLEFKFIFTKLEMNADGTFRERVRKTSSSILPILPVEQWSDYIPDANLDNIVQIMTSVQAMQAQQKAYTEMLIQTKIDNIEYDNKANILKAYADGMEVDCVQLEDHTCEDGVPVVDFTVVEPDTPDSNMVDNVVEF